MSSFSPDVVKIVTIDPSTGQEVAGTTYYGIAYSDDEGYAITRSFEALEDLASEVDLTDNAALKAHVGEHHPHMAL